MKSVKKNCGMDIIIPIPFDASWQTKETIIDAILKQHTDYGFTRFLLSGPSKGWRSIGYPPRELFVEQANLFKEVREYLLPYGIELGWYELMTLKSGAMEGSQRIVKASGELHPFANCPLGEIFKNRFSADVALFAKIAKPAFILFEDDYSIHATGGCFCPLHLSEFEKRYGFKYSREELMEILKDPKETEVIKKWRELSKCSRVELSEAVRRELDKESPEIPVGTSQSGGDYLDGNCTEVVSRALAGTKHVPYSRYEGADYTGLKARNIPRMLYRPLYCRQHFDHFRHYLEADTYPHTRFYTSGCQIIALMSAAFSYGFDGAVFHSMQQFDNPCEETAYGKAFKRDRKKLEEVYFKAKECTIKGVGIKFDPFWYTLDGPMWSPWIECIGRFGIPYTTGESNVVFWDETLAKRSDDRQIRAALSKHLFMDGAAARYLCEKGYTEYLGVSVGDDVTQKDNLKWDLGACEVICEPFKGELEGKNMWTPWTYSPGGNGVALDLKIINEKTQAVTEHYSFQNEFITNGMTYFENALGGKVIVMGMTLKNNHSQPLYNYRRKYIMQELIKRCSDEFCFVEKAPDVMVIENVSNGKEQFSEMLTIINLCEDKLDEISLHIPSTLQSFSKICILDNDGNWNETDFSVKGNSIVLPYELNYCEPIYILIK